MVDLSKRRAGENASAKKYPDISSLIAPAPDSAWLSVPIPLFLQKNKEEDSSGIKMGKMHDN